MSKVQKVIPARIHVSEMTINEMQTTYDLDEDVFVETTQYLIKWEGFGSEDNSWEDEGNVKYWNQKSTPRNKVKVPNKKNQNIANSPVDVSNDALNSTRFACNVSTRTRGTSRSQDNDRVDTINNVYIEGCWENLATISDVFFDYSASQLLMLLIWNDGTRSYHTAQEVHQKCPRQLIKFYESNLQFENSLQEAD
ncbi:12128_t:CDS:2 [Dentiscutata erythropus]|uniref:12128_t:CDS:1 n=1 Tax=Dentiscutata erythropus TaxID=1348616 RepID=A0A9N9IBM2_9GLOM|nr:12128_t:CDS:2 [Dentiscutata erythropus]